MSFMALILLAGTGTFLMRFLPLVTGAGLSRRPSPLTLMLSALGVTAIAALIVLSLVGLWQPDQALGSAVRLLVGGVSVLVALRVSGHVGLATLAGAVVYGLTGL
ncbi:MAG: AzlD domain-containing protein [Saccharospirillum sp.]|uniref:AzlD domain-containing protein n=1 Tax=Saccharospirillum sp. TaxID=2033801 RepID=UPI0032976A47